MFNVSQEKLINGFSESPFSHVVIDDFLDLSVAKAIEHEFFDYDNEVWHVYSNPIEEKKTCNQWNLFPPTIYQFFFHLHSKSFTDLLNSAFGAKLETDPGLHGGGLHCHRGGGNLNPHLDYSMHPKLHKQRKLNIIFYCSSDDGLLESETGALGLYAGDKNGPRELMAEVQPLFNRAVIFDTTQMSWHGLTRPLPKNANFTRKSLAAYYLQEPEEGCEKRSRALFAPRDWQANDETVAKLIKARSEGSTASSVYRT